jgi:hypothetical protein
MGQISFYEFAMLIVSAATLAVRLAQLAIMLVERKRK